MHAWGLSVLAGLLEICWSTGLKASAGLTRPGPTVVTAVALVASMALLSVAVRTLPIGTAYAVWVGIGVLGTTVTGMVMFGEPVSPLRCVYLLLLFGALVGLKTSGGP